MSKFITIETIFGTTLTINTSKVTVVERQEKTIVVVVDETAFKITEGSYLKLIEVLNE